MDDRLIVPGRPFDYRGRDAAALLATMRAMIPDVLPEWTGYESEADFGTALLELFAHVGDIIGYYTDAVANESFLGTAQTRRSVIEHLRLIGYRLLTAAPATAELTVSASERPTAPVTIGRGDAFATASGRDTPSIRFEYAGIASLELAFPEKPDAGGRFTATPAIPVVEGRLVTGDVLGKSDGTAYQRFPLTYPGLILRSFAADELALAVAGEDRPRWALRETLAFSSGADPGFTVEIDDQDRAEIVFGELAPAAGAQLSATYRVGGGAPGNVARDTIKTVVDAPGLGALVGLLIAHPARATGGAPRESIEHAVTYAPRVFRSLGRAVTADDYVAIALSFPGVAKARAFATGWNVVNLVVAPQGGGLVDDVLHGELLRLFEDRRPIGTRVEVRSADFVPVFVTAVVDVEPYYSNARVTEQVGAAVRAVLAFDRSDFGEVIYLSKFFEAIEAVDGVAGVSITEFSRPGQVEPVPPQGKLILGPDELPRVPEPDDLARHPHPPPDGRPGNGIDVLAVGGAP